MIQLAEVCRHVLIAEDDKETRAYLRALMESWGYRVSEAADGQAAVELVRQKCPDLLVLDLNMPKVDGLAAAETIRKIEGQCEHVPIIAVTAHDVYGMRDAALAAGCSDYIRKPIDQDELERVLLRLFPYSF
jgi:two-component system, cell cycle response regulator DivK